MNSLTEAQKKEFNEILDLLGETLDITKSQFEAAVKSYNAVGSWLSRPESLLAPYKPEILTQGSFLLGTMIQNINPNDDIDIDLVCQLIGKRADWTQYDVKKIVGDELKKHGIYNKLLDIPDGRRCWTLEYRKASNDEKEKYHMDILPSIVSHGYELLIEKAYSFNGFQDVDELAIRITDKQRDDYFSEVMHDQWLKSNPFGYGKWFFDQAKLSFSKAILLSESVKPVPEFKSKKLPLQRIVQILKRHRDMMFSGDDNKPISIIITTLAAKAYNKESDVFTGLINAVRNMSSYIGERYSPEHGRIIKWIENPVNPEENFADKWPEHPEREKNYYKWQYQLEQDLIEFNSRVGSGLGELQKSFSNSFGQTVSEKVFEQYGNSMRHIRESGRLRMERGTGILGVSAGLPVKNHNFEGNHECK
ncbi:MAG: nucleotidyltransferase [Reichenbachiella sp.]|uniref:nucleotidyltransferase domain-containing protein n=1 Tax=Reichenbachiella sp. TaxID=2184521 RepID=UPI0032991A5B